MQSETKQRLVGALVIVTIAAIFLPFIFYHPLPGIHSLSTSSQPLKNKETNQLVYNLSLSSHNSPASETEQDEMIPAKPFNLEELRSRAAETTQISHRMLRTNPVPPQIQIPEKVVRTVEDSAPSKTLEIQKNVTKKIFSERDIDNPLPKAWVLQLGSFTDKLNARQLVDRLREMNLDAYTRTNRAEGKVVQVFVGPYIKLHVVQDLQKNLRESLQIEGIIKKYNISRKV